jgi:hypothetical protein
MASRLRRQWRLLLAASLIIGLALAAAGLALGRSPAHGDGVLPAGDELVLTKMAPYGWSGSMAVGTRFTDGLNFMPIAATAKGPLTLLSVTPIMDDGKTLRVLGVLARITPDMLPPNYQTGWFESAKDFPPTDYDATGGVDPSGLVVPVPPAGDQVNVELQVGFEVVAAGKSNKRGVRVQYEYQGHKHEVVVPGHLSICAPASVKCAAQDG